MAANTSTQASLLERLHDGSDPMAWNDFFDRYWPLLFSIARQRGCSQHTAEEVVQDVMLAVFEGKAVFRHDPSRGRFRDWLGGVVRRQVAAHQARPAERCRGRGGNEDPCIEAEASGDGSDSSWQAAFEQAMLMFLLDAVRREISPRTYLAFELFTLGECSARSGPAHRTDAKRRLPGIRKCSAGCANWGPSTAIGARRTMRSAPRSARATRRSHATNRPCATKQRRTRCSFLAANRCAGVLFTAAFRRACEEMGTRARNDMILRFYA